MPLIVHSLSYLAFQPTHTSRADQRTNSPERWSGQALKTCVKYLHWEDKVISVWMNRWPSWELQWSLRACCCSSRGHQGMLLSLWHFRLHSCVVSYPASEWRVTSSHFTQDLFLRCSISTSPLLNHHLLFTSMIQTVARAVLQRCARINKSQHKENVQGVDFWIASPHTKSIHELITNHYFI